MKKILVVDDDPEIIEIVTDFLSAHQYKVFSTTNGSEVSHLAIKYEPDLIILDVVLPDISGFDILKNLKSRPITAFIPVIMLTGQTSPNSQINGLITGADDYVTKPFDINILHARIINALRHSLLPTRQKHDQFNLVSYLIGVYLKRGYECYTKLLDQYLPHPPDWQGFVPDMIAIKPGKLKVFLFETTQSILEESFIERLYSLVECRKNALKKFKARVVVRTKDNYKVVTKLIEEHQLDIEVLYFKKHLTRPGS